MAKRRAAPPETSKIERDRPVAYSRRQKGPDGKDADEAAPDTPTAAGNPGEAEQPSEAAKPNPGEAAKAAPGAKTGEMTAIDPATIEPPAFELPTARGEPWPDATPQPMRPVEPPRTRSETVSMPIEQALGVPPALPGSVEVPTQMPGPRDVPGGNVTDAAPPPGLVPPGDSRSLRKGNEFALVYRQGSAVISRFGVVGQRGQWRVVEYPTPVSASNSYAKEVSRFVGDGFSDYRD